MDASPRTQTATTAPPTPGVLPDAVQPGLPRPSQSSPRSRLLSSIEATIAESMDPNRTFLLEHLLTFAQAFANSAPNIDFATRTMQGIVSGEIADAEALTKILPDYGYGEELRKAAADIMRNRAHKELGSITAAMKASTTTDSQRRLLRVVQDKRTQVPDAKRSAMMDLCRQIMAGTIVSTRVVNRKMQVLIKGRRRLGSFV